MKKIVTLFALITVLCSSSVVKAEENLTTEDNTSGWAQITAGYDIPQKNPAIRFEAGYTADDFHVYGLVDLAPAKEGQADLDTFFADAMCWYNLMEWLGPILEYQGSTGMDDLFRAGLRFEPDLGNIVSANVRVMPLDSTGKAEQAAAYAFVKMPKGFSADFLAKLNYNYDGTLLSNYDEVGLYWNIFGNFSIGNQARTFFDLLNDDIQHLQEIGLIKYEF